jgi:antitoxin HigA-1
VESDVVMPPVHPGEILLTEFLEPLDLSQYQLARSIAVPARRINEIVHGQRRISADTALRLARFFGTSERFWMNLQSRYDLEIEKDRLGPVLDNIHPLTAASLRNPAFTTALAAIRICPLAAADGSSLRCAG